MVLLITNGGVTVLRVACPPQPGLKDAKIEHEIPRFYQKKLCFQNIKIK